MKLTEQQRAHLKTIFDRGLVHRRGSYKHSPTCIEGAIALAVDGTLSDVPSCVAPEDREWAIAINDAHWSSKEDRAEALFPIALEQVGTRGTDRSKWVDDVIMNTMTQVIPMGLRQLGLKSEADMLENVKDIYHAGEVVDAIKKSILKKNGTGSAVGYAISSLKRCITSYTRDRVIPTYPKICLNYIAGSVRNLSNAVMVETTPTNRRLHNKESDKVLRAAVKVALDAYQQEQTIQSLPT